MYWLRSQLLKARLLALFGLALAAAGTQAALLVSDPFTDGSRSNTNGGDLQGLVYYQGQTSGSTLTVADDSAGLGTGNALLFSPVAGFNKYLAYFPPVLLTNAGDFITLSFDYRFTSAPSNLTAAFRVGLYHTLGTRQSADASSGGIRDDDLGYGFQTNPGTNGTATSVYSENSGNDILGGSSPSHTANFGASGASFESSTGKHTALYQITRQPNDDLSFTAQLDNGLAATGLVAAASVLTYRFDELGFSDAGTGVTTPFFVDNLQISAASDEFDSLRIKWWQILTGGTNFDLADSTVKSRLASITNSATNWWFKMDTSPTRTHLWSDLTSTTDSGQISSGYSRLRAMALAFATYGSSLRSNASLGAAIADGLGWMYTNRYNEAKTEYDNWYDWEIGTPLNVTDTAVLMYDALWPADLTNSLNAVDHFTPSPTNNGTSGTFTGANRADKLQVVGVRGAVVKDANKLFSARDALSQLFVYVTSGDGFYTDGSFIQHTRHPYNGSYGSVLLGDVADALFWLQGSAWACLDPAQSNVVQWVYDSYEPLIYFGAMMDMSRGRAISRSSSQDHAVGAGIIQSILEISQFAPTSDAARMRRMVKYWAQVDTFRNFTNNCPLPLLTAAKQLMADPNTAPRGELLGHWTFASMDQAVHLRPGWGFAVSMSSSRIYNYESINGENLHGWFTGDGVTYLYNSDLGQFNSNFWPTVDPYRLPGTTVDTAARADASGQSYLSSKSWVGGATLLTNGVAGLELDAYNSPLTAKKSWFLFDDEVVCLGAGITSSGNTAIQTTIENRKLSTSNTNSFVVNGTNMPLTLGWTSNLTGIAWCQLAGAGGYFFPGGTNLNALREGRTNSWQDINTGGSTTIMSNNFLTLWLDHGVKPTNAAYAYVVLPNFTATQVSNYASAPEINLLENSTNAQAVKETTLNVVAANFWNDVVTTVDLITVNKKAAVVVQEAATEIQAAVADPTQTNTGNIMVTLNRAATGVAFADAGVTVNQLTPTIQMSVNVNNAFGRTFLAKFSLAANSPPSFSAPSNYTIGAGITLTVTNLATDPDAPPQMLNYSLLTGPTNATLDTNTGVFVWRPLVAQTNSTNPVKVKVADNGTPSLNATQIFMVTVTKLNPPGVSSLTLTNNQLRLLITGDFGPDYTLQASTNMTAWTNLFTTNSPAPPFNWTDTNAGSFLWRFYRVLIGP